MTTKYSPDDYSEWGVFQYQANLPYDRSEQDDIIEVFSDLLREVTADGGRKRAAGTKVNWKVDEGHEEAMFRHLERWANGELVDRDSGAHPLVHVAWRCLALAWQEDESGKVAKYVADQLSKHYDQLD